jgi:hypothetical protein
LFDIRYSLFQSFFSRFNWTLAASGDAYMKLQMPMGLINNVAAGFIPA